MSLAPDALAKLKAQLDKGPPLMPSKEHPGPHAQSLLRFVQRRETETGREPNAVELVAQLALQLDMREWHAAMINYQQMKQVYEMHNQPLIVQPGFQPPSDILGPDKHGGGRR